MIILWLLLALWFRCETTEPPEPCPPDTLDLNISLRFLISNGDSLVMNLQDRFIVDSNRFYFDSTLTARIKKDTIKVPIHDTLYVSLPEISSNKDFYVGFNFQDSGKCRFQIKFKGYDSTLVYRPAITYEPPNRQDFEYRFIYNIPLSAGNHIEYDTLGNVILKKTWQKVEYSVYATDFWGNAGPPSLPYLFKWVQVDTIDTN